MAALSKRLATNIAGPLFVDSTCIDCDTCRWMAPASFDRVNEQSRVYRQPTNDSERQAALRALIACPTASIGVEPLDADTKAELALARRAFPLPIEGQVHHCGWHAEASFGATSYFVRRPPERGGNVLVDSPRFSSELVRRLEELGGVAWLLLTHSDDVADHARFAQHFGCRRVLHTDDVGDDTRDVEVRLEGTRALALDEQLTAIPTPGHTRGSVCYSFDERYLFSGDHLAWSPARGHLYAFRDACWFDWETQIASMERLAQHDFEWVLPGHGRRVNLGRDAMREQLARCIAWMRAR